MVNTSGKEAGQQTGREDSSKVWRRISLAPPECLTDFRMGVDEKESCDWCEGLFANRAAVLANVLARLLLFRYNHVSLSAGAFVRLN